MKKNIFLILIVILLTGCGNKIMNTPTKKVEMFFENYQTLNEKVINQLDEVVEGNVDFNSEQKDKYRNIMKKHYQSIKYEVKDEKIDGDVATVTVEIEVKDYSKALTDANKYLESHPNEFYDDQGNYDKSKFLTYRLNKFEDVKDTVKYTLDLTLTKIKDEWVLDNISNTDEQKIHGMYIY